MAVKNPRGKTAAPAAGTDDDDDVVTNPPDVEEEEEEEEEDLSRSVETEQSKADPRGAQYVKRLSGPHLLSLKNRELPLVCPYTKVRIEHGETYVDDVGDWLNEQYLAGLISAEAVKARKKR